MHFEDNKQDMEPEATAELQVMSASRFLRSSVFPALTIGVPFCTFKFLFGLLFTVLMAARQSTVTEMWVRGRRLDPDYRQEAD